MSAQSGLSRAIKQNDTRNQQMHNENSEDYRGNQSNRASQKDVIVRSNSSKKFLRPTS